MQTQAQNFVLPTMPFRREIPTGCPVGTTIQLIGKPYQDVKRAVLLILSTNNHDIALRCELQLTEPAKVKIDCTVSQKTSTAIENLVVCPYNQRAALKIVTLQHSFQIFFNDSKIADFVHRVDPTLIKMIEINGPLITEEVIITPAVAPPLPTYQQATSPPVELMSNMSLSNNPKVPLAPTSLEFPPPPAQNVLIPSAPPAQIPIGAGATTVPSAPAAPSTSTPSSSFYYTGGSQGFSNHPYPLPGLIDNGTYPSQQHPVGTLPSAVPVTVAAGTVPQVTVASGAANPTGHYASTPIPAPPPTNAYTPAPTPSVPYTVTFPQSASSTPAFPQPIPQPIPQQIPQQRQPIYQNQAYNPYPQGPPVVPTGGQVPLVPIPGPTSAAIPVSAMQPQVQYPSTYMYPTVTPMVQPYPVYQQPYPYSYGPEVIYYEGGHHHHHRHHFFGHHHHHCD